MPNVAATLLVTLGIITNVGASLFLKLFNSNSGKEANLVQSLFNPSLLAGVALYGLAFCCYILALKFFPVNYIHPILTAGAIVGVNVGAFIFFGERMHPVGYGGLALIIGGVALLAFSK